MEENSLIEKRFCSQRLDKIWEPETVKWVPKKLNKRKTKKREWDIYSHLVKELISILNPTMKRIKWSHKIELIRTKVFAQFEPTF